MPLKDSRPDIAKVRYTPTAFRRAAANPLNLPAVAKDAQ
jgi:hypothetical protein